MKSLLIEFFVEEMPSAQLLKMRDIFSNYVVNSLQSYSLDSKLDHHSFISYKRFGILINNINPELTISKRVKGPAVGNQSLQKSDNLALVGFCRKYGVTNLDELEQSEDGYFYLTVTEKMVNFNNKISDILPLALKKMVSSNMTWNEHQFIRPIRNLIVMLDNEVLPINLFGCIANNTTLLGKKIIKHSANTANNFQVNSSFDQIDYQNLLISHATEYFKIMAEYNVFPDFEERKSQISKCLHDVAQEVPESLLEEVTGLIESPLVLTGHFDQQFLALPKEVLILTMAKNQKYFAMNAENNEANSKYNLSNQFLFVADISYPLLNRARLEIGLNVLNDIEIKNIEAKIISDNQQVLTARLVDAKFFYEQDFRLPQENNQNIFDYYNAKLQQQVYHAKLGSQWDRVQRIIKIKDIIVSVLNAGLIDGVVKDVLHVVTPLLKFDLTTTMVGEFPELQGIIGAYYYRDFVNQNKEGLSQVKDGSSKLMLSQMTAFQLLNVDEISDNITEHYKPKFSNDSLPRYLSGVILALSDKIEHVVGMWLAGNIPTSEKDPYGLRRSALGIIRILVEWTKPSLNDMNQSATSVQSTKNNLFKDFNLALILEQVIAGQVFSTHTTPSSTKILLHDIKTFIVQRYKIYLLDNGIGNNLVEAVIAKIMKYDYMNLCLAGHTNHLKYMNDFFINNSVISQSIKRMQSLVNSKLSIKEECDFLIDFTNTGWYKEHTMLLAEYDKSILQKKLVIAESAKNLQDYLLSLISDSTSRVANTTNTTNIEQLDPYNYCTVLFYHDCNYEEYTKITQKLSQLVNVFLDDTMVFDETNLEVSQFHQKLLTTSYAMMIFFLHCV